MFKHKSIYVCEMQVAYIVFVYLCIIKVYISYEEFTPSVRVDTQISSANHWSEYFSSVDMTPPLIVYQLMTPVKGIFPGRLLQQGETYGAVFFHITVDSTALEIC